MSVKSFYLRVNIKGIPLKTEDLLFMLKLHETVIYCYIIYNNDMYQHS